MSDSIKLTNSKVLDIYSVLSGMKGKYTNKLKFAIKRNKDLFNGPVDGIKEKSVSNDEKLAEYNDKRTEKIKECAVRDENGNIIQETADTIKIQDSRIEEFRTAIKSLSEEYKESLDKRRKELEDFNKFLTEETDVEVFKFSNELIPEDLSQEEYEILFPLIND